MLELKTRGHRCAGLASGLKSMAKGVLAGTVGLVAAPIIGAHQDGFAGLAKGTVAGLWLSGCCGSRQGCKFDKFASITTWAFRSCKSFVLRFVSQLS